MLERRTRIANAAKIIRDPSKWVSQRIGKRFSLRQRGGEKWLYVSTRPAESTDLWWYQRYMHYWEQ